MKILKLAALAMLLIVPASAANATTITYVNETTWSAAASALGAIATTASDARNSGTLTKAISLSDGGQITTSSTVRTRVAGVTFSHWMPGHNGEAVYVAFSLQNSLTLNFADPVFAFGFYIKPGFNLDATVLFTLSDSTQVSQTFLGTKINEALFFGWVGEGINSVTIEVFPTEKQNAGLKDVGVGHFLSVSELAEPVPEPASLALLGAGLFGVFGLRRRRAARA